MHHVVTISGSPCANSKSTAALSYALQSLRRYDVRGNSISIRELPPEDLIYGRTDSPAIQNAHALIAQAEGVIIATPVCKGAYSGVLKTYLDLLPPQALEGKAVLPIVTGGSPAHQLALDYALKPVLSTLGASHILGGVYILDSQIQYAHGGVLALEESVEIRLAQLLEEFRKTLSRIAHYSYSLEWAI